MNRLIRFWFFVRVVIPSIVWLVVSTFRTVLFAIVSLWRGVPESIHFTALHWRDEAVNGGWPTSWDRELYWFFYATSWITFLVGWVVSAFLTVFVVHLIF